MSNDWGWWLASDQSRDSMLRDEIDYLARSASMARTQSARLSSQLANLQGSLESRLSALSAAFDAYVELGDVREQLAGYPDTSAIRRDALAALETLSQGRTAELVHARGLDYWLVSATNTVIALMADGPDAAAGQMAPADTPDAELFVVATVGALGRGQRVAERVPALLVCDGAASAAQVALWHGVLGGLYGEGTLSAVSAVWRPALDLAQDRWLNWSASKAQSGSAADGLTWLEAALGATPATAARAEEPPGSARDQPTAEDPRAGLRTVALALISAGTGAEAALLDRSRRLRERIENPGVATAEAPIPPTFPVTDLVRTAWLAAPPGSSVHQELTSWLRAPLLALTTDLETRAQALPPPVVTAEAEGSQIDVTLTGPDLDRVAGVQRAIAQTYSRTATAERIRAGGAVVLLVLVLVFVTTGHAGLAVLAGIAAVVALAAAVRQRIRRTEDRARLATALGVLQSALTEATDQVRALDAARQATVAEARARADRIRGLLGAEHSQLAAQAGGSDSGLR